MTSRYPFFRGDKPRIIGHRGAMGEAPENTLLSFRRALEDGAQCLELDVHGSKDGEVVIIHDDTLERTTNGRGEVRKKRLRELEALDAAYWFSSDGGKTHPHRGRSIQIPTLEEFFLTFPDARAIIEIKQARPPIVKRVMEIVRRLKKQDQVLLATERDEIMREIRKELARSEFRLATGFSYGEVEAFIRAVQSGQRGSFSPPGQAMQIPCEYRGITLVSEATVKAAHDLGVEMFVWTVNQAEEMERLLSMGVDGIISDYPKRVGNVIARRRTS